MKTTHFSIHRPQPLPLPNLKIIPFPPVFALANNILYRRHAVAGGDDREQAGAELFAYGQGGLLAR